MVKSELLLEVAVKLDNTISSVVVTLADLYEENKDMFKVEPNSYKSIILRDMEYKGIELKVDSIGVIKVNLKDKSELVVAPKYVNSKGIRGVLITEAVIDGWDCYFSFEDKTIIQVGCFYYHPNYYVF